MNICLIVLKSCRFLALRWIWIGYGIYQFCLTGFGFNNLVLNFFATISSVSVLQITAFNL